MQAPKESSSNATSFQCRALTPLERATIILKRELGDTLPPGWEEKNYLALLNFSWLVFELSWEANTSSWRDLLNKVVRYKTQCWYINQLTLGQMGHGYVELDGEMRLFCERDRRPTNGYVQLLPETVGEVRKKQLLLFIFKPSIFNLFK